MSDQVTMPGNIPAHDDIHSKALLDIVNIIDAVEKLMNDFAKIENMDSNLTSVERKRLIGAGVRNWGFIDKAYDISRDNPAFLPPNFSSYDMGVSVREFEEIRQLVFTLNQFQQLANDAMLLRADACYRLALRMYGSLREQARNKVKGADALFQALLKFFRRRRRPDEAGPEEPTEKELERDFHRMLHGTADGRIEIINERPRTSAGVHEAIDEVNSGHAAIKETRQGESKE
jgi:hypothetical protein